MEAVLETIAWDTKGRAFMTLVRMSYWTAAKAMISIKKPFGEATPELDAGSFDQCGCGLVPVFLDALMSSDVPAPRRATSSEVMSG